MTVLRRLQARVQRWRLLGRYYANKWHYDGSKWADRVWYGQGISGSGPAVASVAFMITRSMRQQLQASGFPPSAISALQPAAAQKILADKITYAQFQELQKQQQVEQAAEAAKRALELEDEQDEQHQSALVAVETSTEQVEQEKLETSAALVIQAEVTPTAEYEPKKTES